MRELNLEKIANESLDVIHEEGAPIRLELPDNGTMEISDDSVIYVSGDGVSVVLYNDHPCYEKLKSIADAKVLEKEVAPLVKAVDSGYYSVLYNINTKTIRFNDSRPLELNAGISYIAGIKIPKFAKIMDAIEAGKVAELYSGYHSEENPEENFLYINVHKNVAVTAFVLINQVRYDVTHTKEESKIYNKYISDILIKHIRVEAIKIMEDSFGFTYRNVKYTIRLIQDDAYEITIIDGSRTYYFELLRHSVFGEYLESMLNMTKYVESSYK